MKEYFGKFGEVLKVKVMRNNSTSILLALIIDKSRGFGFVEMRLKEGFEAVLAATNIIAGKKVSIQLSIG